MQRTISALLVCLIVSVGSHAATGMIYVKSNPTGATVFVDGENKGTTNVLVRDVTPGRHRVEIRRPGATGLLRMVDVEAGKVAQVVFEIPSEPASLTVVSEPLEADVYVDGRKRGVTPLTLENLSPGKHEVLVRKGALQSVKSITLAAGENRVLEVKLAAGREKPEGTSRTAPRAPEESPRTTSRFTRLAKALEQYGKLLAEGRYADAAREAERKAGDARHESYKKELSAAAAVARSLGDQENALQNAVRDLVGKETTLDTTGGEKTGVVKEVSDAGIVMAMQIKMRGKVLGETKLTVKWDSLTAWQKRKLTSGKRASPADVAASRALVALAEAKPDEAVKLAKGCTGHPLSAYIADRASGIKNAAASAASQEAEDAAEAAWTDLRPRLDGEDWSIKDARRIISRIRDFKEAHGRTQFARGIADEIADAGSRAGRIVAVATNLAVTPGAMVALKTSGRYAPSLEPGRVFAQTPAGLRINSNDLVVTKALYEVVRGKRPRLTVSITIGAWDGRKPGDETSLWLAAVDRGIMDKDIATDHIFGHYWIIHGGDQYQNGAFFESRTDYGSSGTVKGAPIRVGQTIRFTLNRHGGQLEIGEGKTALSTWWSRPLTKYAQIGIAHAKGTTISKLTVSALPASSDSIDRPQDHMPTRELDGRTYGMVRKPVMWEEARKRCVAMGGHLATITTRDELALVQQLFRPEGMNVWIGLTDKRREGTFEWVTGEPVTLTDWRHDQPNDQNFDEDFVAIGYNLNGMWGDFSDSAKHHHYFICEWEPGKYKKP